MTDAEARRRFDRDVNMTADEIRAFLATPESKKVGFTHRGERESRGRQSARKIIKMLEGGREDIRHKHKVVGYIARHLKQRPRKDVTNTPWRWAMMNWGHDPLK